MIIRSAQMEAMGARQGRLFLERMVRHLDEAYPGQIRDRFGAETRPFADAGIAKAGRYGIEMEGDIEAFLDMLVVWGPDFDVAKTWAATILNEEDRKGSDKIALLQEHERFGESSDAARSGSL